MIELYEESEEYFEGLGFTSCGQYEWENNDWIIEYMGTNDRPNCWRIDNLKNDGHQLLFIDLKDKKELEWLLKAVNVNAT